MTKNAFKFIGIIIFSFLILIVFSVLICRWALSPDFKTEKFTTSAGDTFVLSYDSHRVKTIVEDYNSRFYFVVNNKVTKDDFEIINDSPKTYKVKDIVFSDTENGFEIVND